MNNLIDREMLRRDLVGYAVCAGNPTLLSRVRAVEVIDNIPEAVVRCRECADQKSCKSELGEDGYCSKGRRA